MLDLVGVQVIYVASVALNQQMITHSPMEMGTLIAT
jgi:hypothetical protein